jgi:F-type H+-transporting ATPase subunit b
MNFVLLFAAAAPAAEGNVLQKTAQTFGWNLPMFIAQLISFCIVAFLLHRFAYKPILTVLEERRQRIAQSLADVERIKGELAQAEVARQEILSSANSQAVRLIEEARAAAARVQEVETQKAIAAAEQIIAKAREAAAADHVRMLAELRREVGRLVVETTARVSGKVLGADDQKRLTDETTRQLAA